METTGLKSATFRKIFAAIIAVLMLSYLVFSSMPFLTYTDLDEKKLSAVNSEVDQKKSAISSLEKDIRAKEKELKDDPSKTDALTAEIATLKDNVKLLNDDVKSFKKVTANWTGEKGKYVLSPAEFSNGDVTLSLNQYLWFSYNYRTLTSNVLSDIWKDAKLPTPKGHLLTSTIGFPLFSFLISIIGAVVVFVLSKKFWNIGFPIIWSVGTLLGLFISPVYKLFVPSSVLILTIISALVLVLSIIYLIVVSIPLAKYTWEHRERY